MTATSLVKKATCLGLALIFVRSAAFWTSSPQLRFTYQSPPSLETNFSSCFRTTTTIPLSSSSDSNFSTPPSSFPTTFPTFPSSLSPSPLDLSTVSPNSSSFFNNDKNSPHSYIANTNIFSYLQSSVITSVSHLFPHSCPFIALVIPPFHRIQPIPPPLSFPMSHPHRPPKRAKVSQAGLLRFLKAKQGGSRGRNIERTSSRALNGHNDYILSRSRGGRHGTSLRQHLSSIQEEWDPDNLPPLPPADKEELDDHIQHLADNDDAWQDIPISSAGMAGSGSMAAKETKKKKHYRLALLDEFLKKRQYVLDEFVRHEGLEDTNTMTHLCCDCLSEEGLYRCRDCFDASRLFCAACTSNRHSLLPLHRLHKWNGAHFERSWLIDLGLRVSCGHGGVRCKQSSTVPTSLTVLHTTGIHHVAVDFCECNKAQETWLQLHRMRWWPATYNRPNTAITYDFLDTFHRLNLNGKLTIYDYYNTIHSLSDNTGIMPNKSRYDEARLAVRLWRNIKALKRAGRGHDVAGVEATSSGSLAIECAACPHPGKNLPPDWKLMPKNTKKLLYTLHVASDGNYKLKQKNNHVEDRSLLSDWGYFVRQDTYKAYVDAHKDEIEPNECDSKLHAVDHANKNLRSYACSGVGACKCSRHTFVRPNGVGDLTGGEKFCNMDFIIFSALTGVLVEEIGISYDIACQYAKNLHARMEGFPDEIKLSDVVELIRAFVPDMHVEGHGDICKALLGFLRCRLVGRTCGEGIETEWAVINQVTASIREMSPSGRHEVLNDHWGYWNWSKTTRFALHLPRKLTEAIKVRDKQRLLFDSLTSAFAPSLIAEWTLKIEEWDALVEKWEEAYHVMDEMPPLDADPYREPIVASSVIDIRSELAEEEEASMEKGVDGLLPMTRSRFILAGFELEQQQRSIKSSAAQVTRKKRKRNNHASLKLQDKRTHLRKRILNFRAVQESHMPFVPTLLNERAKLQQEMATKPSEETGDSLEATTGEPSTTSVHFTEQRRAENIPLFLPSSLPPHVRANCHHQLITTELRLRIGQAYDSLREVQRQLRDRQMIFKYKQIHVIGTGQGPNTRARSLVATHTAKANRSAKTYIAARTAIINLDPTNPHLDELAPLRKEHLTFPKAGQEEKELEEMLKRGNIKAKSGPNESKRLISWIWTVGQSKSGEVFSPESLRVEWSKARSRVQRWEEEVQLLVEEMRRVIAYFQWKAEWWLDRRASRESTEVEPGFAGGLDAYARRQSRLFNDLARHCAESWVFLLQAEKIPCEWAESLVNLATLRKPKGRGYGYVRLTKAEKLAKAEAAKEAVGDEHGIEESKAEGGNGEEEEEDGEWGTDDESSGSEDEYLLDDPV